MTRMINMGDTLASSERAVTLAEAHEGLYAGVGIHPEEAFEMTAREDDILAAWATKPEVVAIGEIGLDYYWEKDPDKRRLQQRIFIVSWTSRASFICRSASTTAMPMATPWPSSNGKPGGFAASALLFGQPRNGA